MTLSLSDKNAIIELARKEIEEEKFRAAVALKKEELRKRKTFWMKLCPYEITIKRRINNV